MRKLLRAKQGNTCCFCGKPMVRATGPGRISDDAETIEHLRRKCDGGTDDLDNLALSCHGCNYGRGLTDWLTYTSYRRGELFA
ncbi:HNH endonuclease [Mesorhizobium sp. ESP-6-4]|nr:HNH endonuclease [Mesorhizobium sp. ESP-6-4]